VQQLIHHYYKTGAAGLSTCSVETEQTRAAAPTTTATNAATRAAPEAPPGIPSWNTAIPATIGSEFVNSVATPAVARARPRWKPSCKATNAGPWHASRAETKNAPEPPATAALVPTSPPAYRTPGGTARPAPGPAYLDPAP